MSGGLITGVSETLIDPETNALADAKFVDLEGDVVMPGLLNPHSHQLVDTPFSASAAEGPGRETASDHRDEHLLQGHTTVVNVDSFCLPSEIGEANADHPLKLELAACPTPANFEAADLADGAGLTSEHRDYTIPKAIEAGAVLLGEVGSGSTLAGGAQRYMYVPRAVEEATGKEISPPEAGTLVEAVLGPYADPDTFNQIHAQQALKQVDLADDLSPEELKEMIMEVTWPSVKAGLHGFDEVGDFAEVYDVPMMVHNSAPSRNETEELAQRDLRLIAGHSNHSTYPPEEALEFARILQSYDDVVVEINSWDLFTDSNRLGSERSEMEQLFFDFIAEGLADILATDFAGGNWVSMLRSLEQVVENGVAPIEDAIALATGNVAEALPAIGATRGTLAPGKAADVLVVDGDAISDIQQIYVDGTLVAEDGELLD
jgi:hypothetical protein